MKLNRLLVVSLLFFVFPLLSYADQLEDANSAIKNEDYKTAYKLLLPLAEENNPEAQAILGSMYVNGQGVKSDIAKGLSWIMKAAKQGFAGAKTSALKINLNLAKENDTSAMYNVGNMCLNGWGGDQSRDSCLEWLETAAKLGHDKSAKFLSHIYKKGEFGITPDEEKSSYWENITEAGIDGTWTATMPGGMGGIPMKITYEFSSDGDILTGSTSSAPGQINPIREGKIDGKNISFEVDVEFNKRKMTHKYTGTLLGDQLFLSYKNDMGDRGGYRGLRKSQAQTMTLTAERGKTGS